MAVVSIHGLKNRRALCAMLALWLHVSCQSSTQFVAYADSGLASSLSLQELPGGILTLSVERPAIVYLREVVIEGMNGSTILELGDDTGLKNQAFSFVVPGQPAVVAAARRYQAIMQTEYSPAEAEQRGDDREQVLGVIYSFCVIWALDWPLRRQAEIGSENFIVYQSVGGSMDSADNRLIAVPVN